MKKGFFPNRIYMLRLKLDEEQKNYSSALKKTDVEFWQLKKFQQKIRRLKNLLHRVRLPDA